MKTGLMCIYMYEVYSIDKPVEQIRRSDWPTLQFYHRNVTKEWYKQEVKDWKEWLFFQKRRYEMIYGYRGGSLFGGSWWKD